MPGNIEDYVHRIGRTGRAGASGTAISFFTELNKSMGAQLVSIMREAKQEVPQDLLVYDRSSQGFHPRYGRGHGGHGRGGYGRGGYGRGGYGRGRGGNYSYKPRDNGWGNRN